MLYICRVKLIIKRKNTMFTTITIDRKAVAGDMIPSKGTIV